MYELQKYKRDVTGMEITEFSLPVDYPCGALELFQYQNKRKKKLFRQYFQSFNKCSNAIHRCNNQELLKAAACNYCI